MDTSKNAPSFHTRLEGRAYAHFEGPHNADSLKFLHEYLKRYKWSGSLRVAYSQGGVMDVIFEEIKKATQI